MGQTYGSSQTLPQAIALAAYTATPLWLIGIISFTRSCGSTSDRVAGARLYRLSALYRRTHHDGGSEERGFLFSSAVLAVGLVMLVGVLAASAILWGFGLGPSYTSQAESRAATDAEAPPLRDKK